MIERSMHVKKNDVVVVIAGKDKGRTGKILRIFSKSNRVLVEKINIIKRHTRPSAKNRQGGIVEKESPLHVSNVMLYCTKCTKPVKSVKKMLDDGNRVRICKKCGESFDK